MYKNSDEGKKVISLFDFKDGISYDELQEVANFSEKWGDMPEAFRSDDYYLFNENVMSFPVWESPIFSREEFEQFVQDYDIVQIEDDDKGGYKFLNDEVLLSKNRYRDKNNLMGFLSMSLYAFFPNKFKPLFHKNNFPVIQRNCDALGIDLPPIPRTKDYKEYMVYYWDLCQVWNEFQKENNLSNAEFCACLYDFAPMLIQSVKEAELPKPTNVWLVGAAMGDFQYLDNLGEAPSDDNPNSIWQCNERTKRGDIIVVYCRTPRSYIHSIWRANSSGVFNPFDYYQCRTTICNGIKIPPITINDLKSDPYLSQLPIVRKNLQGVNGVELSAKDYSEILRFLQDKCFDTEKLPKLFECVDFDFGEIKLEKDVEEKILIPILLNLGYDESNWTRQLSLKAGRGLKAIPDFVFFPKGDKHFESAPFVIEAKLDMSSMVDRINAYKQSLSYARLLRSKLMAICDKERLIVYEVDKNGSSDINTPIYEEHWVSIYSDEIAGANLKKIIGKEVVGRL